MPAAPMGYSRKSNKHSFLLNFPNADLMPFTIISEKIAHDQLSEKIKEYISESLLSGASVIFKPRQGIDYSINSSTRKPFENIKQLYMQQIRNDKNYKCPYFMPLIDIKDNGFVIMPKNKAVVLSSVNKFSQRVEFTNFFNINQLKADGSTLEITENLLNSNLDIPYTKTQEIEPFKPYIPKSILLTENFSGNISKYFKSCYTGEPYDPPGYSKEEINKLASFILKDNSKFFEYVKNAHAPIKSALLNQKIKKKRDHARVLK